MGEATRRGGAPKTDLEKGYDAAEREQIARVRQGAHRHAVLNLGRARTAGDQSARTDAVAAIHAEAARVLDDATESFLRAARDGPAIAARIACRKGCAFCCYVQVEATVVEVIGVAAVVEKDAALVRSVLETAPRVAGLDALGRARARVPCPLLRDGACSIYADRPRSCRALTSYDARRCEDDLNQPDVPREPTRTFTWPRVLASAATEGIRGACRDLGLQDCTVELTEGVAAVLRDPAIVARWLAGEAVFPEYKATRGA